MAEPIREAEVATMRRHAEKGESASGSMGTRAEAACRLVVLPARRTAGSSYCRLVVLPARRKGPQAYRDHVLSQIAARGGVGVADIGPGRS